MTNEDNQREMLAIMNEAKNIREHIDKMANEMEQHNENIRLYLQFLDNAKEEYRQAQAFAQATGNHQKAMYMGSYAQAIEIAKNAFTGLMTNKFI